MERITHEELKPLDLETFKIQITERQRASAYIEDLYKGLYLGLPKGLRNSLRELARKAVNERIAVPQSKRGVLEAVTAIRLTGPQEYQTLLENSDIRYAIDLALDSARNGVPLAIEEALDATSNQVEEVMEEVPAPTESAEAQG